MVGIRSSKRTSAASIEDADLVARLALGDEAALEKLYERYGDACFALAKRILIDRHLAEDVVQQSFLALWSGSSYEPSRGSVGNWLLAVTHHKSVDMLRREGVRRERATTEQALVEIAATGPGPDDEAWQRLRAEHTRAAVRDLPAEQREVVLLAYYGGYTQREIAEMTGLPLGTVKTRTLAAMRSLRARLAREAGGDRDD
jgi:RNA polymerase sigma factor (sigma-70 family)